MTSKTYHNSRSAVEASLLKQIQQLDDDLKREVEKLSEDSGLRDVAIQHYLETQRRRDETAIRQSTMTAVQKRREEARLSIASQDLLRPDIHHVHSVLALCNLPYKKPDAQLTSYVTKYGNNSLRVEAGSLLDPKTGEWVQQGIPFGSKARLLQLHICTRALRQNSPVVEIEASMSAFIASMGYQVTGGKNGTIGLFKEQLNRLAACSMKVGLWDGHSKAKTISVNPIKSFEVWFPEHADQQSLWPSQVVLNQDFFESLREHALPIDIRALVAVSNSSRQMDILMWLSYRVRNMKQKYFLRWDVLKEQFCQSPLTRMTEFKRDFRKDIQHIEEIFEKNLPIRLSEEGVFLFPCDPSSLFVPPKQRTLLKN
jgi:hypothetical protein